MFQLWAKMWKDSHLLKDITISNDCPINRTKKVFDSIEEVCRVWDLSKPIWLEANVKDFKRHSKTRFTQDSFLEPIEFDFLEIHMIEED